MSQTDFCRLCANLTNTTNSRKLFERSQRKLLNQVQELIGLELKNTIALPQVICKSCHDQTLQAHQFRQLCIRAQQQFATEEYRIQIKRLPKRIQNVSAVVVHTEPSPIKADNEEEQKEEDHEAADNMMVMQFDELGDELKYEQLPDNEDDNTINTLINSDEEEVETLEIDHENYLIVADIDDNLKSKENIIRKYPKKVPLNLICDQCGRHFKYRHNFVIHMRRHTGDKPFQCELCPAKYMAKQELKRHIRSHTGELPYPCRYCERKFREISSRVRHERRHTNVRPFACDQCDKAFTQSQSLKIHMVTHTGERAFECNLCNVGFKIKSNLRTHYQSLMHKKNMEKQDSTSLENQHCLNLKKKKTALSIKKSCKTVFSY